MFTSAPSLTFTSIVFCYIPVGQLDSKLGQDLCFVIWVCVIQYCCYWSWPGNTMKSSQHVNVINIVPVYFDAVGVPSLWTTPWTWPWSGACLPLLGLWHLSVLLPCMAGVLPLCRSESCPLLQEDLQHELKWFLKPHLWHFLPKAGPVFKLMHSVTLTARFAVSGTLAARSVWTTGLGTFLTIMLECLDRIQGHWLCNSSIQFVAIWNLWLSFRAPLAYWSNAWYVTSSRRFFDRTHFFTSKCLVAWNKSSVLRTSFSSVEYLHLSMRFLILW